MPPPLKFGAAETRWDDNRRRRVLQHVRSTLVRVVVQGTMTGVDGDGGGGATMTARVNTREIGISDSGILSSPCYVLSTLVLIFRYMSRSIMISSVSSSDQLNLIERLESVNRVFRPA